MRVDYQIGSNIKKKGALLISAPLSIYLSIEKIRVQNEDG
jgi:hypothetical protein